MLQVWTEHCITTLAFELHMLELHVCPHWFESVPYVIEFNSRVIKCGGVQAMSQNGFMCSMSQDQVPH